MNKTEYNKYTMYRAVQTVTKEYIESVRKIPKLFTHVTSFNNWVEVIEAKDGNYQNTAKGTTAQKHSTADELIFQIEVLCGSFNVYGQETGNKKICEMTEICDTLLHKMRDPELLQKGKALLEVLLPLKNELAEYGIEAEQVTKFNELINNFNTALDNKDNKHIDSVNSRDTLHKAFTSADEVLRDKIDNLMENMRVRNVEFYNKYKQARAIKELGIRHQTDENPTPSPAAATV
jgi:hypothetical protein